MLTIEEIRKKYPQYKDISDEKLLDGFHRKFYSNIPREEFFSKFNISQQPQQERHGWIRGNLEDILSQARRHAENIADLGMGFKGGVEKLTHGIIQPLAERGYLGGNVQQGFRPMVERNAQELQAAQQRSPLAAGIGNLAGMIGVRAPAYTLSGGSIPALGAIGAAYGGASLPEEGESRLENARNEALADMLLPVGLKVAGKTIGSIQKVAPEATKAVKNVAKKAGDTVKSFSTEHNVNKILADKAAAKAKYSGEYGELFKSAEDAGIKNVKKPNIKTTEFFKNSEKKYNDSLADFLKKPSLENAHQAQSDLGKYVAKMEKSSIPLTYPQIKALEQAQAAQSKIREEIVSGLNKFKSSGTKYEQLTKGYKNDVVPYSANKIIKKLEKGEISKKTAAKKLAKDEAFNIATNGKYPGLQRSASLSNLLSKSRSAAPYAVAGALLGYGKGKSGK